MDKKQKDIARKVKATWKMYNDESLSKEEKQSKKEKIQQVLDKYNMEIDWKTGNVTLKQAGKQAKQETKQADNRFTTKDLINLIYEKYGDEWTGKNLRRKLRQMEKYDDGKVTHYNFSKQDIQEVLIHLGYIKAS